MRESRTRVRRPDARALTLMSGLVLVALVLLALEAALGAGARAWRALSVNVSIVNGMAQGAALIAALAWLRSPRRKAGLRRAAEVAALSLPLAAIARAATAGLGTLGGKVSMAAWALQALAGFALAALGVAYVRAAMGPDTASALERGEIAGRLPAWLARAALPEETSGHARTRVLATAYTCAYVLSAPLLAAASLAAPGTTPALSLAGYHAAASDLYVSLAAAVLLAAFVRARHALDDEIPVEDFASVATGMFALGALLGLLLFGQLVVPAGSWAWEHGLAPPGVSVRSWRVYGALAWLVGYVVPCTALLHWRVRERAQSIARVAGLALAGVWLERFALRAPAHGEILDVIDVVSALGCAALCAASAIWLVRRVGLATLFTPVVLRSSAGGPCVELPLRDPPRT